MSAAAAPTARPGPFPFPAPGTGVAAAEGEADEYGVLRGHVETVHSFTNDQNLLDNCRRADRRGSSMRVPAPDVPIAILSLRLGRETTREEVPDHLREVSVTSTLKRQIDFTTAPDAVSSDFIGSRHASAVLPAGMSTDRVGAGRRGHVALDGGVFETVSACRSPASSYWSSSPAMVLRRVQYGAHGLPPADTRPARTPGNGT